MDWGKICLVCWSRINRCVCVSSTRLFVYLSEWWWWWWIVTMRTCAAPQNFVNASRQFYWSNEAGRVCIDYNQQERTMAPLQSKKKQTEKDSINWIMGVRNATSERVLSGQQQNSGWWVVDGWLVKRLISNMFNIGACLWSKYYLQ